METIKNVSLGVLHGLWDSIRGMTLVLHIDEEINRQNAEREAERRRRRRRSPSPVPSSAAAMMREEQMRAHRTANPDERSLDSIRKRAPPADQPTVLGEKKIAKQVLKCCLLNGGFTWLSIILFEQLLLPILKFVLTLVYGTHTQELHLVWGWLQSILSIIFGMMWVLPIFLLSKIVSSLWFADIANAAYQVRKGRPQLSQSISKLVADFLFSLVVQVLFLMQSMLVNMLPVRYVGEALCFLHLCLLYSLYSFEYKWFNMGWELHRRLSYIENNWPYFMGFGIPLTVLTNMSSSLIVSSCIFSIFFPLFILSGNEARPLVGTISMPLRLFSPVIYVSNLFFSRSVGPRASAITAAKIAQQQQQSQHQRETRQRSPHQQHSRSSSQQSVSQHSERQHRYQQPPPLQPHLSSTLRQRSHNTPSPLRSTPERGNYAGIGMRPLIPTPVPGAPKAPAAAAPTTRR